MELNQLLDTAKGVDLSSIESYDNDILSEPFLDLDLIKDTPWIVYRHKPGDYIQCLQLRAASVHDAWTFTIDLDGNVLENELVTLTVMKQGEFAQWLTQHINANHIALDMTRTKAKHVQLLYTLNGDSENEQQ